MSIQALLSGVMVEFPGDLRVDGPPLVSRPVRCGPAGSRLPLAEARSAADMFEALSDPVRVRALWLLVSGAGPAAVDLAGVLGVSPEVVTEHLAVLVDSGLVRSNRDDGTVGYEIVAEKFAVVRGLLDGA